MPTGLQRWAQRVAAIEPEPLSIPCPACEYDLTIQARDEPQRMICPECGSTLHRDDRNLWNPPIAVWSAWAYLLLLSLALLWSIDRLYFGTLPSFKFTLDAFPVDMPPWGCAWCMLVLPISGWTATWFRSVGGRRQRRAMRVAALSVALGVGAFLLVF